MPGQLHQTTDDFDLVVDEVSAEIEGVSSTLIEHHVMRTIIDFCERSQIWQEDVGPIVVRPGVDTYEIFPDREKAVVQVKTVFAKDGEDLIELDYGKDPCSWAFYHDSPSHITVLPLDELEGKRLIINAAVKPVFNRNAPFQFSQLVVDDYFDAISAGTKARVFRVPGKEYSNPNLSVHYQQMYEAAANDALVRAGRDFARMPHRLQRKPRRFY